MNNTTNMQKDNGGNKKKIILRSKWVDFLWVELIDSDSVFLYAFFLNFSFINTFIFLVWPVLF